jgi:hypothetical protein
MSRAGRLKTGATPLLRGWRATHMRTTTIALAVMLAPILVSCQAADVPGRRSETRDTD